MKNNRDIQFRAYDVYNKCWSKGDLIIQLNGSVEVLETNQPELIDMIKHHYAKKYEGTLRSYISPGIIDFSNYPEVILQQYTGLKDKSGVGIFEGDIIKRTHVVEHAKPESHYFQGEYWMDDRSDPMTYETREDTFEVFYNKGGFEIKSLNFFQKHAGDDTGKPYTYHFTNFWEDQSQLDVIGNIFSADILKQYGNI